MKENKKVGWKAYVGSGLVIVGSVVAGWGFGKKDTKTACLGTFIMSLGGLLVIDNHSDVINHNAKVMNELGEIVSEHEERLRRSGN